MMRLNRLSHEAICRAGRSRYLDLALVEIQNAVGLPSMTTFVLPVRPEVAAQEHATIIDGIAGRDRAAAEQARAISAVP